jgi:hypothetical protein
MFSSTKSALVAATTVLCTLTSAFAQLGGGAAAPATAAPAQLEPAFAILKRTYPKVDAKKNPKAPADSVWLFRSATAAVGTAEVAFQGTEVVYMIFRRGTGGASFKRPEIAQLHELYSKDLLKEPYVGKLYNNGILTQINAAAITRKDFDAKALLSSQ